MLAYLQQSPRTATAAETDHGDIELVDGVVLQISSEAELDRLILATGSRLLVLEVDLPKSQVMDAREADVGNCNAVVRACPLNTLVPAGVPELVPCL